MGDHSRSLIDLIGSRTKKIRYTYDDDDDLEIRLLYSRIKCIHAIA